MEELELKRMDELRALIEDERQAVAMGGPNVKVLRKQLYRHEVALENLIREMEDAPEEDVNDTKAKKKAV